MRSSTRVRLRTTAEPGRSAAAAWAPTPIVPGKPAREESPAALAEDFAETEAVAAGPTQEAMDALEAALREESEIRVAAAYEEGFAAGYGTGVEEATRQLGEARGAALAAAAEIRSREGEWAGILEENVCALGVAVARQVIGRELETDRLIVLELARSAVEVFRMEEPLRIRVSPDDHVLLTQPATDAGELVQALEGRPVSWISDPAVESGGCVIEGRERIVDGRVDTALTRAFRILAGQHA